MGFRLISGDTERYSGPRASMHFNEMKSYA